MDVTKTLTLLLVIGAAGSLICLTVKSHIKVWWHKARTKGAVSRGFHCWGCLHCGPDFHRYDYTHAGRGQR